MDGPGWTTSSRRHDSQRRTRWTSRIETVYNFGVDEYHTYFVGEVGAWVHNCYSHRPSEIAAKLGYSKKDITNAIHKLKSESKIGGSAKNPDVLIDTRTGDAFIQDPKTGKATGDVIDNIYNYLKETP